MRNEKLTLVSTRVHSAAVFLAPLASLGLTWAKVQVDAIRNIIKDND